MTADFFSLMVYGVALLLTLLIGAIVQKQEIHDRYKRLLFAIAIALPLTLVAGFRYGVGTDYFNYIVKFEEISYYSIGTYVFVFRMEPLFVIIVKLLKTLQCSDSMIFGVLELIILVFPALAFIKCKDKLNINFAFLLYYLIFYHYSLNTIRQVMAISIVIYALSYFAEEEYGKYTVGVIAAMMVHYSAVVCLAFLVIPIVKKIKKKMHINKLGNIAVGYVGYYSLILLSPLIIYLFFDVFLTLPILEKFAHYSTNKPDIGAGLFFTILVLFVPMYVLCKETIIQNARLRDLADLSLMYLPLSFVGYMGNYAERIGWYGSLIFILYIPMLCQEKKDNRYLKIYYICYFLATYISLFIIGTAGETFPYQSIFR